MTDERSNYRMTLLGTGSSGGVPRIGGEWGACDPKEPRNRRGRCSALVERLDPDGGLSTSILIDTAPDFREQCLRQGINRLDAVLLSHDHADQTHGLDDLRAIARLMARRVPVYLDRFTADSLMPKFGYAFEGRGLYPAILERKALTRGVVVELDGPAGSISALPLDQIHGPIRSLGFRFGPMAYCNDVSELPDATLEQLTGLTVLVVDALRYQPHPTHAHLARTLSWIEMLQPKRAVLTNLHIDLDYKTLCGELPDGVEPGYDGMTLEA
ncbi:MAG: MBL fold metallo-hydrolase [Pseudomonadota bacterium]